MQNVLLLCKSQKKIEMPSKKMFIFFIILLAPLLRADGFDQYVERDKRHNLPSRLHEEENLKPEEQDWKETTWGALPEDKVKIHSASPEDERDFNDFISSLKTNHFVVPVHPDVLESGVNLHFQTFKVGQYTRLLSRKTFAFKTGLINAFFKFSPYSRLTDTNFTQPPVLVTKYLRELFYKLPRLGAWEILEEPLSAYVMPGYSHMNYSFVWRKTEVLNQAEKEGFEYISLHSLFGCKECLENYAKAAGLTPGEWVKSIYLPKLAEVSAEAIFRHGLFFEDHTQNLIAVIDPKSGQLIKFVRRDLSDVVVDPLISLMAKDEDLEWFNFVSINMLSTRFVDDRKILACEPGYNFSYYTAQSVVFPLNGEQKLELSQIFLRHFMTSVEKFTAKDFSWSVESQKLVKNFLDAKSESNLYRKEAHRTRLRDAWATLIEVLYQDYQAYRFKVFLAEKQIEYDPNLEKKVRQALREEKNMIFTSRQSRSLVMGKLGSFWGGLLNSKTELKFAKVSGRLFIFNSDSKILAYSIHKEGGCNSDLL